MVAGAGTAPGAGPVLTRGSGGGGALFGFAVFGGADSSGNKIDAEISSILSSPRRVAIRSSSSGSAKSTDPLSSSTLSAGGRGTLLALGIVPATCAAPSIHGGGCVTAFGGGAPAAGTTIGGRSPVDDSASFAASPESTSVARPPFGGSGGGGFEDKRGPPGVPLIVADFPSGGGATPRAVERGSIVWIAGEASFDGTDGGRIGGGDDEAFAVGISSCVNPVFSSTRFASAWLIAFTSTAVFASSPAGGAGGSLFTDVDDGGATGTGFGVPPSSDGTPTSVRKSLVAGAFFASSGAFRSLLTMAP
jgi:hypothetical protein